MLVGACHHLDIALPLFPSLRADRQNSWCPTTMSAHVCKGWLQFRRLTAWSEAAIAPQDVSGSCEDAPLRAAIATGHVTFVHLDKSQMAAAAAPAAGKAGAEKQVAEEVQQQQQQQLQEEEKEEESAGAAVIGAAAAAAHEAAAAQGAGVKGAPFGMGSDELELVDDE